MKVRNGSYYALRGTDRIVRVSTPAAIANKTGDTSIVDAGTGDYVGSVALSALRVMATSEVAQYRTKREQEKRAQFRV